MKPISLLLAAALALSPPAALANVTPGTTSALPDLGDAAQETLSRDQEGEIARAVIRELRRSGDIVDDPEWTDYLNQLGYQLVSNSGDGSQAFSFFPVNDSRVNAAAYPGGVVIVHSGLFLLTGSEAELAAVLAHEVSHVSQRHLARLAHASRSDAPAMLLAIALAILAASRDNGSGAMAAVAGAQGALIQKQLNYSRDFEREADRVGMETLVNAGFDPRAMPAFFSRLERHNRAVDSSALAFLRTHPVTSERISDSEGRASRYRYRQSRDSLEFQLAREKARVLQSGREQIDWYRQALRDHRYQHAGVMYYGLALAQLQAGEFAAADDALTQAATQLGDHAWLERLRGDWLLAQGKFSEAETYFQRASERHPSARALLYGAIDASRRAGHASRAVQLAQAELSTRPADARLYQLQAAAYADLGQPTRQHQAQAERYVVLDEIGPAIEQLEIASRLANDDFYLQSALEARLNTLRQHKGDNR